MKGFHFASCESKVNVSAVVIQLNKSQLIMNEIDEKQVKKTTKTFLYVK